MARRLQSHMGRYACHRQGQHWLDCRLAFSTDIAFVSVQLLHLHPLTLEDILQKEPHEKLELFPRLGYYFVSFRAIESQATRERFRRLTTADADQNEYSDAGGAVGEVNIYLVVFREGVCSVSHHSSQFFYNLFTPQSVSL